MEEASWLVAVVLGGWAESTWPSSASTAFFDLLVFVEAGGCFEALALRVANGVARALDERLFFWVFGMLTELLARLQEIDSNCAVGKGTVFSR